MEQASRTGMVVSVRKRFTIAQVNAGADIVSAVPGMAYRLTDFTMIAVGGAAATATSVDIIGTRSAATVRPFVVAVSALTEDTLVKPNTANVTALAAGASYTALDKNTAVTIGKQSGGSELATATHIDVILSYAIERP